MNVPLCDIEVVCFQLNSMGFPSKFDLCVTIKFAVEFTFTIRRSIVGKDILVLDGVEAIHSDACDRIGVDTELRKMMFL